MLAPQLFLIASFISLVTPQNSGEPPKAPSTQHRVFTNDDVEGAASQSADRPAPMPGLIQCGADIKCFLSAVDAATLAAVTRSETVEIGTAVVTSNSTWWVSQFTADHCTLSFRVNSLEARLNPKAVPDTTTAHEAVEARLCEMRRDFDKVRGQTSA